MLNAYASSQPGVKKMDDTPGWVTLIIGVLAFATALGREIVHLMRKKQDAATSLADKMLKRIETLEKRDEEVDIREDTLRLKIEKVEKTAVDYQRQFELLSQRHDSLMVDHQELMTINKELQTRVADQQLEILELQQENDRLVRQTVALHEELNTIYKQIGVTRRSVLPPIELNKRDSKKGG